MKKNVNNKKFKIAITGAGGGVGQGIIKSLYDTDYGIVALDGENFGTGLYAVPCSYKIPYAKSEDFIPVLLEICRKENISLLFPGMDAELMKLSLHRDDFANIGTIVVVSLPEVIKIANDKMHTYNALIPFGVSVPKTKNIVEWSETLKDNFHFPVIIKQKLDGARSKNVFLIQSEEELVNFMSDTSNILNDFIIQEYIEGDEYTCGTITLNGECKGVIVMRRILRDGDTYKCFSEHNAIVEMEVHRVVNGIKPFGACNVQLRVKDGKPYVFEINARCSGTTAARTLCGFNEPKMIADFLLKQIEPEYVIEEKTIFRYWKELVVENNHVEMLKKQGFLKQQTNTRL